MTKTKTVFKRIAELGRNRRQHRSLFAYEQRTTDCQPFFDRLHEKEITAVLLTNLHPEYTAPEIFVYELELDTSGAATKTRLRASTESSNSS